MAANCCRKEYRAARTTRSRFRSRGAGSRSPVADRDDRVAHRRRLLADARLPAAPQRLHLRGRQPVRPRSTNWIPNTGEYTVYKVPHDEGTRPRGHPRQPLQGIPQDVQLPGCALLSPTRKKDGNIFITPSMQQALLEFDVDHASSSSYSRHARRDITRTPSAPTTRTDVWFTLALSSQVAMLRPRSASSPCTTCRPARLQGVADLKIPAAAVQHRPEDRPTTLTRPRVNRPAHALRHRCRAGRQHLGGAPVRQRPGPHRPGQRRGHHDRLSPTRVRDACAPTPTAICGSWLSRTPCW